MKIAISSSGNDKEAQVDSRFGRCPYFAVVDTETDEFEFEANQHKDGAHGVGPQVVQMLSDMGVEAVITGNVGPNAHRTLEAANIEIYNGDGAIGKVYEGFKEDSLQKIEQSSVGSHAGRGGGGGGRR
ncbi:MAG: NifB/NifX family molybdenum-iron cluster-binding protein [Thermoplasmatota archaeon]